MNILIFRGALKKFLVEYFTQLIIKKQTYA